MESATIKMMAQKLEEYKKAAELHKAVADKKSRELE